MKNNYRISSTINSFGDFYNRLLGYAHAGHHGASCYSLEQKLEYALRADGETIIMQGDMGQQQMRYTRQEQEKMFNFLIAKKQQPHFRLIEINGLLGKNTSPLLALLVASGVVERLDKLGEPTAPAAE